MSNNNQNNKVFNLSPSYFSFLWEDCKRCYYLHVVNNITQPSKPMPSIFTKIAGIEKRFFDNKHTSYLSEKLPPGKVIYGEKYVKSISIAHSKTKTVGIISGRFDNVVRFEDGTYGVVDFKTSGVKEDNITKYSRQLHAYAYALENPAPGALSLSPITRLGLLCLEPHDLSKEDENKYHLHCKPVWIECEKDEKSFLDFIDQVLSILSLKNPPEPSQSCAYCNYRRKSRVHGH